MTASLCALIDSDIFSFEYILLIEVDGILFLKSINFIKPSSRPVKAQGIDS